MDVEIQRERTVKEVSVVLGVKPSWVNKVERILNLDYERETQGRERLISDEEFDILFGTKLLRFCNIGFDEIRKINNLEKALLIFFKEINSQSVEALESFEKQDYKGHDFKTFELMFILRAKHLLCISMYYLNEIKAQELHKKLIRYYSYIKNVLERMVSHSEMLLELILKLQNSASDHEEINELLTDRIEMAKYHPWDVPKHR